MVTVNVQDGNVTFSYHRRRAEHVIILVQTAGAQLDYQRAALFCGDYSVLIVVYGSAKGDGQRLAYNDIRYADRLSDYDS